MKKKYEEKEELETLESEMKWNKYKQIIIDVMKKQSCDIEKCTWGCQKYNGKMRA